MELCKKQQQTKRRQLVQNLHRETCFELYRDDGQFALERGANWRSFIWDSLSFLNGEKKHIKNVLEENDDKKSIWKRLKINIKNLLK